jgi:ComF family protein
MRYTDASKGLILRLKHADRHEGVGAFGKWLARAGAGFLADVDVVTAVPLHRLRLLARLYNQAALLALALAEEAQIPTDPMIIERVCRTPSQGGLSRRQRRHNVAGAFRVRPGWAPRIEGQNVLVVDDVMTTGATVEACARTLKRAGAKDIYVLTLARVVRPS